MDRESVIARPVLVAFATFFPDVQTPKLPERRGGSSSYNSEAFASPVFCPRQRPMNRTLSTGSPHGCDHSDPCEPHHLTIKDTMAKSAAAKAKTIISAAQKAGTFKTLLSALDAADLTSTLSDPKGNFTVFAPTDDAFKAVDKNVLTGLLKPEKKKDLQRILKHHVVRGRMDARSVSTRKNINPLDGGAIKVRTEGSDVFLGDAQISQTDIEAENGVIHVINAVLMPKAQRA